MTSHFDKVVQPGIIHRREFLKAGAALTGIVVAGAASAQAPIQVWEEGDVQCRVAVASVTPQYTLDEALLINFISLSQALTGVRPLSRHLATRYLERYASHPRLSTLLPQLISALTALPNSGSDPSEADIDHALMQNSTLRPATEQLIFLWYFSAFFLPPNENAPNSIWIYGTPEEYEQGLVWSVIRAHAPMTRGGPYGYWADAPTF